MAFQNTSFTNIDNLNLGIPINQNVETDILSQDELNAIIMSQMGNNTPIQTIPVSQTIIQQEVQQEVAPVTQQPNYVNHPIYPTTTNTVPDKYEIDSNNVEDWEQEEADTTSKTWIEQMSEKSEKTVKQKDHELDDDDDSEKDEEEEAIDDVQNLFEEIYLECVATEERLLIVNISQKNVEKFNTMNRKIKIIKNTLENE